MKRLLTAVMALAVLALTNSPAAAALMYNWTLSGLNTGSGQLTVDSSNNITSFTGSINGNPVTLLGGQPGVSTLSPSGLFSYDNVLYPLSDAASCAGPVGGLVDCSGILFTYLGGEGNIWFNGDPDYGFGYETGGAFGALDFNGNIFAITQEVPEAGSLVILAAGLLCVFGFVAFRRREGANA